MCTKDKYWYTHLGVLLVFLVLCHHTMLLQTGHKEQWFKDHVSTLQHKYTHFTIFTYSKKNHNIASLDYNTCFRIKELCIRRTFRGKREGMYSPQSWDQNKGVHNQPLRPLPKHNTTYWKGKKHKILADKHSCFCIIWN